MDLREAFVALRPKRRRMPQFDEQSGIDRRREGNREQRQNAVLAGKIEPARIAAAAPHRGDTGPGAKHEASLGEDQGPARRALLAKRQKRLFKTLYGTHAKLPCDRFRIENEDARMRLECQKQAMNIKARQGSTIDHFPYTRPALLTGQPAD